jgi:hypothetical protein
MRQNIQYPKRQLIEAVLLRQPESVVDVTVRLWEQLMPELVSIIGEGGFKPLYARSIRLASAMHPSLAPAIPTLTAQLGVSRFSELRTHLAAMDATQAGELSLALFDIFLGTLASLIGEGLTAHVLQSAWPPETFEAVKKDSPT